MVASNVADLPLVGGHPALDLVNTVEPRLPGTDPRDHLGVPADLLTWARRTDLLDSAEADTVAAAWTAAPPAAEATLRAVHETREALYTTLCVLLDAPTDGDPASADDGPTPADDAPAPADGGASPADGGAAPTNGAGRGLEYLALRWAAAAARTDLVLDGRPGYGARLAVGSAPALLIADRVAYLAVELLCDLDPRHLRACPPAEGGCGWLFLDQSRNGTRRWCVMAECGARAKARRLTERRRAARQSTRDHHQT